MLSVAIVPFPDHVNLGVFRKLLLVKFCRKVKSHDVKKSSVSKDCSLFYVPGTSGCATSEIHTSEELDDLLCDVHKKEVRKKSFNEND